MTESQQHTPGPGLGYFASSLTTVLTLSGVAIGLGNVWRFPYMMGAYGGSAFLLIFLFFMLVIAVPALMAELSLARTYRGATIRVMSLSFGRFGRVLGYALVGGVAIAASYYTLIVGNVVYSAGFSLIEGFAGARLEGYAAGLHTAPLQYVIALGLMWSAIFVISRGLKDGIERVSNLFVPFFFLVCLYLVWFALSRPGAVAASLEFLKPDFSRIGMTEVFAALGAAYILVYGKFLQERTNIASVARYTALSDLGASVLASLFIVPSVLLIGVVESIMLIPPTWNTDMIGTLDLVFGSGTPVVGCLFAVLAIGWRVRRSEAWRQLFATDHPGGASRALFGWLRWVIPAALALILLATIYSALSR